MAINYQFMQVVILSDSRRYSGLLENIAFDVNSSAFLSSKNIISYKFYCLIYSACIG